MPGAILALVGLHRPLGALHQIEEGHFIRDMARGEQRPPHQPRALVHGEVTALPKTRSVASASQDQRCCRCQSTVRCTPSFSGVAAAHPIFANTSSVSATSETSSARAGLGSNTGFGPPPISERTSSTNSPIEVKSPRAKVQLASDRRGRASRA